MELFDVIDDILEHENMILPSKVDDEQSSEDELLFNKLADFIVNLDPDKLTLEQVNKIINMIEGWEVDDLQEIRRPKLSKKTPADKNQYSKKWYRTNKQSIKRRKKKFRRSSEGRKRLLKKDKLAKIGRTATGRRKVRYHTRKKANRRSEKDENIRKNR